MADEQKAEMDSKNLKYTYFYNEFMWTIEKRLYPDCAISKFIG